MSLYNALFGVNKMAPMLAAFVGVDMNEIPRFRDAWLSEDGETVVIYTRTGGGNRESYEPENDNLASKEAYAFDRDDDFDCTYAEFHFRVPEKFLVITKEMASANQRDPKQQWSDLFSALESGDKGDPQVIHAMEVGKQILGPLFEQLNKDEPK